MLLDGSTISWLTWPSAVPLVRWLLITLFLIGCCASKTLLPGLSALQPAVSAHFHQVFNKPLPAANPVIDASFLVHYFPFPVNLVALLSSPIMVSEVCVVVFAFGLYRAPGVFGLQVGVL